MRKPGHGWGELTQFPPGVKVLMGSFAPQDLDDTSPRPFSGRSPVSSPPGDAIATTTRMRVAPHAAIVRPADEQTTCWPCGPVAAITPNRRYLIANKSILVSTSPASIFLRISVVHGNRHFSATVGGITVPISVLFVTNCQDQTRKGKLK
jgi:hypothetical protein